MAVSLSSKPPVPPCRSCSWFALVPFGLVVADTPAYCTYMEPVGGVADKILNPDSEEGYCAQYEEWVY